MIRYPSSRDDPSEVILTFAVVKILLEILLATLTVASSSSEKLIINKTDSFIEFLIIDNVFLSSETTASVVPSLSAGKFFFKLTKFLYIFKCDEVADVSAATFKST